MRQDPLSPGHEGGFLTPHKPLGWGRATPLREETHELQQRLVPVDTRDRVDGFRRQHSRLPDGDQGCPGVSAVGPPPHETAVRTESAVSEFLTRIAGPKAPCMAQRLIDVIFDALDEQTVVVPGPVLSPVPIDVGTGAVLLVAVGDGTNFPTAAHLAPANPPAS